MSVYRNCRCPVDSHLLKNCFIFHILLYKLFIWAGPRARFGSPLFKFWLKAGYTFRSDIFSFAFFLQTLNVPVTISENVKEPLQAVTDNVELVFVCEPFEGEDFELLRKEEQRIIGPPVVHSCAKRGHPLPYNSRPLYCSVMSNLIVCFTGFRKKEDLGRLCNLVHHMGGSIRREFSGRVTQLVANSIHGQKYRVSMS